jgi:hypothetical protein
MYCKTSRQCSNKKHEYPQCKINEPETELRDTYRGINKFKRVSYWPGTDVVTSYKSNSGITDSRKELEQNIQPTAHSLC